MGLKPTIVITKYQNVDSSKRILSKNNKKEGFLKENMSFSPRGHFGKPVR
jgi:hypothetical protein